MAMDLLQENEGVWSPRLQQVQVCLRADFCSYPVWPVWIGVLRPRSFRHWGGGASSPQYSSNVTILP